VSNAVIDSRPPSLATVDQHSTGGGVTASIRHALVIAKRSLIKLTRTPEQLIDVTLQPIIFLALFTYIFGGAIAGGSQHDYLEFLLPGLLGQSIAMAGVALA
jgi:oleandomycin transport system permease protein